MIGNRSWSEQKQNRIANEVREDTMSRLLHISKQFSLPLELVTESQASRGGYAPGSGAFNGNYIHCSLDFLEGTKYY